MCLAYTAHCATKHPVLIISWLENKGKESLCNLLWAFFSPKLFKNDGVADWPSMDRHCFQQKEQTEDGVCTAQAKKTKKTLGCFGKCLLSSYLYAKHWWKIIILDCYSEIISYELTSFFPSVPWFQNGLCFFLCFGGSWLDTVSHSLETTGRKVATELGLGLTSWWRTASLLARFVLFTYQNNVFKKKKKKQVSSNYIFKLVFYFFI